MNNLKDNEAHPRAIDARAIYGRALGNAGRLDEAVPQLERVVPGAAAIFGPESPMIGFYSADLAKYYAALGELERSIETAETSMSILSKVAAPDSFTYAAAQYRRGASLLTARRATTALEDLTDACEKLDAALGPTHLRAATAHALQAIGLSFVGETEKALRENRAAIDRKGDGSEIRLRDGDRSPVVGRRGGSAPLAGGIARIGCGRARRRTSPHAGARGARSR